MLLVHVSQGQGAFSDPSGVYMTVSAAPQVRPFVEPPVQFRTKSPARRGTKASASCRARPSGSNVLGPAHYRATQLHFQTVRKRGCDPGDRRIKLGLSAAVPRRKLWLGGFAAKNSGSGVAGPKKYPAKVRISPLCCHGLPKGKRILPFRFCYSLLKPLCCRYPVIVPQLILG